MRLVNSVRVQDDTCVGFQARVTGRLVQLMQKLRDIGNTVVVVEHEPGVMRAADQIVDLGPGHGEAGGEVGVQGSYRQMLSASSSLKAEYLGGAREVGISKGRPVDPL